MADLLTTSPDDPAQYGPIDEAIARLARTLTSDLAQPGDYAKARSILIREIREWGRLLRVLPPPAQSPAPPTREQIADEHHALTTEGIPDDAGAWTPQQAVELIRRATKAAVGGSPLTFSEALAKELNEIDWLRVSRPPAQEPPPTLGDEA